MTKHLTADMSQIQSCGTLESAVGAQLVIDGKRYINFGGSSYLGLSSNPQIIGAGIAALRELGSGSSMLRDQGAASRAHREVEAEAARFFGSSAAMYLASGYHFGLVALAAIVKQFSAIFFDEATHHCLREAITASGVRSYSYLHLNIEDLETKLEKYLTGDEKPLVATDGVFGTIGEIAPLDDLCEAITPYGGYLLVDESHAFGVLGASGRGAREHFGVGPASSLAGGSLGKAFGTSGGLISASDEEIAALRATPAGLGASPGLPAAAAMCAASLRYLREHPEVLANLRRNVVYMKSELRKIGLTILENVAPVAAFSIGSEQNMRALKNELRAEGIFVYHTHYVGAGPEGLIRCGIFADHTSEHIDRLIEALRRHL
jgi:8-amino-7-oxononanoate synthase